jgi:hypothetical protein
LFSFENACKSSTRRSSLTCWLVTSLKLSIIFNYSSLGKVFNAFSLWLLMIMLGHSNKVHLTGYIWIVEDAKRVWLRINWNYNK